MKCITESNITNKKVLLRCDLNVTIENGLIIDETKIKESAETIKYLLNNNCSVIILSHLGKIKTEEDKKNNSLKIVEKPLEKYLNKKILFSKTTRSTELTNLCENLKPQEIVLVENTRFEDFPNKLETNCDEVLSKYWGSLADVFVNDAFGTTHRKHASNYGVTKYLESYYGLLIKKEITGLQTVINPDKPFTVIMGGAKVKDKIQMIKALLTKCDYLIVGGGIANTFLKATGNNVGISLYDKEYVEELLSIYKENKSKIILPKKVRVLNDKNIQTKEINEIDPNDNILDILLDNNYTSVLEKSNTVFLNGTLGYYEKSEFAEGTKELLEKLANIKGKVIIGGGDALASVNKLGNKNDYYFISTGGGATLEYIKTGKLLALESE